MLSSCSNDTTTKLINEKRYHIQGRDLNQDPIYRFKTPLDWTYVPPKAVVDLQDTKNAIAEFLVDDIRITIHNFPSETIEDRINPKAQIFRWKKQFDQIFDHEFLVTPESFSGFKGALLEATGNMSQKKVTLIAFSMQLGEEHYRRLQNDFPISKDLRADFTIKALGPFEQVENRRDEIISFAKSFELIKEIRYP